MDWTFWLPLTVNFIGLLLTYVQIRMMKQQMSKVKNRPSNLKVYWPVFLMLLFMVGVWIPYVATAKPKANRIIVAWGVPGACGGVINTVPLMPYNDGFGVAMICGVENHGIDRVEDQRITVTPVFTITGGDLPIQTAYSKGMADAIQEFRDRVLKDISPAMREQASANITVSLWHQVVLLPKNVNTADIHKVSDVKRNGGKLLADEGL